MLTAKQGMTGGRLKKECWITLFNIRNDMPQEVLKIINNKGFNWYITFSLPESYTDFWQYN